MILVSTIFAIASGAQVKLTLSQAVELARDSSANIRMAASRVVEAEAKRSEAKARLMPEVTASASQMQRSYNFLTGGIEFPGFPARVPFYSIQDVRLGVKGPLYAPSAWFARSAAEIGVQAKRSEREALREDAALRAGLAWVALGKAQALEKDRDDALALALELERIASDLKESGVSTGLDLLRARSQVVASQRALEAAHQSRDQASIGLARELGLTEFDTIAVAGSLPLEPSAVVVAQDGFESARIQGARQARSAAERDVAASRARFLPTVGFEADYGYSGRHLADDGEWTGQVGLFAEWSLWDGGSDDARLAQARERERQAALAATEIARTTSLDRHDAIRTLDRTREGLRLATVQAALADSQIVLARDRFREGGSGNLEVVQAQAERNAAHAAWIDAAGAHQAALVRLRWATGRWDGI